MTIELTFIPNADQTIFDWTKNKIRTYNNETNPHFLPIRKNPPQQAAILIQDENGNRLGCLTFKLYWQWLDLADFWLSPDLRKQGFGSKMLSQAETYAVENGCKYALVETYRFQAKGFYEKHGYMVIGQIDDYPPGECKYTLRKSLHSGSENDL